MPVKKGRGTERRLAVEVEGERHFMPKGCDPITGPQLEELAGKEVEVLMVRDVVLAIRDDDRCPTPINRERNCKSREAQHGG